MGDIIQSTYDLVDFTWKILLYGILLATLSKIFAESRIIDLGRYLITVGFGTAVVTLFVGRFQRPLAALAARLVTAGLIVSFYIPVSTMVWYHACEHFVSYIEKDLDGQLAEVLDEWQIFRHETSLIDWKAALTSAGSFVKELFLRLTRLMVTYTCLVIIKYLLFPIIVAYGFFLVSKYFLKHLIDRTLA